MEPVEEQQSEFAEPSTSPALEVSMPAAAPVSASDQMKARPVPRISIQAFCEDPRTAESAQVAASDRRLSKTHFSVHMGGVAAAIGHYQEAPTPNLIIVESVLDRDGMLADLDRLAEVCDAGTRVVLIGHLNDVILYRELVSRGVSEYLIAPIAPLQVMQSISNIYNDPDADPVGHVTAYVGAKGGVGSSTVCHNSAWTVSRLLQSDVVIADMDLPFGTAGLDFNQDPVQGIADALHSPERLDEVLLDRLLSKCSDNLALFAAPGTLDRDYDLDAATCESVLDVVRQNVPNVAVDVPHVWTAWAHQILIHADEVVLTATPDLANLRNAKNMLDLLRQERQNDRPPHLVINMAHMPKRPEIPLKDFAGALELTPAAIIDFSPELFGMASNNGQMVEELDNKSQAAEAFHHLAHVLTNRPEAAKEEKKSGLSFLKRLSKKK